MSEDVINISLEELEEIFNASAVVTYRNKGWTVSLHDAYVCQLTGSTITGPDKTTRSVIAAGHALSAEGTTLRETIEKLNGRFTQNARLLISNEAFGLFVTPGDDNQGPHTISVYEGGQKIDEFPFDETRVRTMLESAAPAP